MENIKQMELEILIAIRNNETIPAEEFYKLFENRWPDYSKSFSLLYDNGMFKISCHDKTPGLNKFVLTTEGKLKVTELLQERSNDLHVKLSEAKQIKNLEPAKSWSSLLGITDFVSHFSLRFKRQIH